MQPTFWISVAVCVSLLTHQGVSSDDAAAVQGKWKPSQAELGGQPMPDAAVRTIILTLDHGRYEVLVGEAPDRGSYTLDTTTSPRSMTVAGTEGPNAGKTYPAIYELKGDTLRICYDLSGAKRPAEFKTVAGTRLYLVTYIRQKE